MANEIEKKIRELMINLHANLLRSDEKDDEELQEEVA